MPTLNVFAIIFGNRPHLSARWKIGESSSVTSEALLLNGRAAVSQVRRDATALPFRMAFNDELPSDNAPFAKSLVA